MKSLINPFLRNITPPEQAIIDRKRVSKFFSSLIAEGGALEIYGERGIGKSLMLKYISSPSVHLTLNNFQNHIFVFVNCSDSVHPKTASQFWFQCTKTLDRKLEDSPIKEKCKALLQRIEEGAELGANDFHDVLDVAAGVNKRIVLVLDDFDALIRTDTEYLDSTRTFLQGLRSLTTRDFNKANLVVATRYSLQKLCKPLAVQNISPFENGFTSCRLQLFREDDILKLLHRIEQTDQPSFTSSESRYIAYLSGYHPQLAEMVASEIFDHRIDVGAPLTDLTPVGEKFQSVASPVFERFWEGSSPDEQMLLMLIALQKLKGKVTNSKYDLSDITSIFSQKERELIELNARGLLNRTQTNPSNWEIFSPIFEWWILKEIESSTPEQLDERRRVWGSLLTQKQADKIGQTLEFLNNHKDSILAFGRSIINLTGNDLPMLGGG